ncbi:MULTISPECIES: exopolyphosphatase [Acetobacterium]|jgi:exopolyphosphatase/guanosine-5'-triphosphate,3'-diphosphate pyrophosphatase|uniref:Ppx/GppA phosphatase family protein n=1 Tax=Acetobacterium TaxID=33951 RepID=UPI0020347327|nr:MULTISPECIES: exopolyphosphatase [Acetobacterium]URN83132.1 exopolyphosphatase [Acetobacterium wieringae]
MIKRFSVIYIGSIRCELIVGQRGKGCIKILDRAMFPINFGSQSFTKGEISFKSVYALCQTINEYIEMSKTYGVESIKIFGTTALREARNRLYILEQIKINTGGYEVEILDKEEETHLIYRHMVLKCDPQFNIITDTKEDQMLASISSGNVSVALLKNGVIDYHQTAELGYLKMKEILKSIEENSERFETLLMEFISINTQDIVENIRKRHIKRLFVSSHEVDVIAQLCGITERQDYYVINAEDFGKLCKVAGDLTVNQLLKKYPLLDQSEAETLNHTLMLYLKLLAETGVETFILIPMIIGDAFLDFEFQITKKQQLIEWIEEGSYLSAKTIGKKYHTSHRHSEFVEKISLKIFDSLKKYHQLGKRERQLLSMLCYLMEVGSFIDHKNFWVQSRYIIETTDIIGVNQEEKAVMGKVAEAVKTNFIKVEEKIHSSDEKEQLLVAKLAAILKLAIALDKSYQQKIQNLHCHVKDEKLMLELTTGKNFQLEEYFFKASRATMENVYGIKPILKIKRVES